MQKCSLVPSVDRALKVMELLAESRRGFSLSDLSRRLALPKSSAHLIVRTLEMRGYLQKNGENGKYFFGLKLINLSHTALENLDLREQARPFLQRLMLKTGLTVHLAVLERSEAVIIDKVETPGMLRLATWIGRRLDANSSGVGKALLAFVPEPEIDRQFTGRPLAKYNNKTIISAARLKRELKKVRELGYAFEDEEGEVGVRCIGSPIVDSTGNVIAAVSVAGTTSQVPLERVEKLALLVKAVASEISAHLARFGYVQRSN